MMLYICTKFQENISKGFRVIDSMRFVTDIFKEHNSVNSLSGVMVLVLFKLSDSVLYLYKVLSNYLLGFQSCGPEQQG